MQDMKNFGPTPRTMKDAFEKYLQTPAPQTNSHLQDISESALWWIGALIVGAAIGALCAA